MSTHIPEKELFKRINFFPGFFTTATDWNDGETYHLGKRELHNRGLHSSGVLFDRDLQPATDDMWATQFRTDCQALKVCKISESKVKICKGAALDCDGNLIYLPTEICFPNEATNGKLEDELKEFQHGNTIYIALKFQEKEIDRVEGEFSGCKRKIEEPQIVFFRDPTPKEHLSAVRLASFKLKKDAPPIGIDGELVDLRVPASAKGLEKIKDDFANLSQSLETVKNHVAQNREFHEQASARLQQSMAKLDKTRKQENRCLHTPGVFNEYEQSGEKWQTLRVSRVSEGKVMVAAGAALDNNGNLLFFSQDTIKLPNDILSKCKGDKTVYVALKFDEALDSTNTSSLATNSTIEFLCDLSDVKAKSAVGLARLKLSGDATHAEIEGPPEDIRESASVKGLGKLKEELDTWSQSVTLINNQAARNHEYYREHNRALHTAGVFNVDEEPSDRWETLRVTIKPGSERAVTVARGFALDSNGNVLYYCDDNPIFLPRDIADICTGDKTVYVALKFDDSIRSSDSSGLTANAKIVFLCDPSDVVNNQAVALATIQLTDTKPAQIKRNSVKDRRVPTHAKGLEKLKTEVSELANSLARIEAQVAQKYVIPNRDDLMRDLEDMRESFGELAWKFPARSLDDVRHAVVNLEMSIHSQMMTEDGLQASLSLLYKMIRDVPDQFTASYQPATNFSVFTDFKKKCLDDSNKDNRDSLASLAKLARNLSEVKYSRSPTVQIGTDVMKISTGSTDATLTMRFVTKDHGTP